MAIGVLACRCTRCFQHCANFKPQDRLIQSARTLITTLNVLLFPGAPVDLAIISFTNLGLCVYLAATTDRHEQRITARKPGSVHIALEMRDSHNGKFAEH